MATSRVELPTVPVAAYRATVPPAGLSAFYERGYHAVRAASAREGWRIAGPAIGWYSGRTSESVDVAAAFPVEGAAAGARSGDVTVLDLPGGAALVLTHTGPYEGLLDAWRRLDEDRQVQGAARRGDFWEEYVVEPGPDIGPDDYVTRLVLPLVADV